MTQRSTTKSTSKTGTASLEFDDFELQATMQNFLEEEEKETGKGIWNFATISGLMMLFLGISFVLNTVGVSFWPGFSNFIQDVITALPLIGGALVTLIGFGFFVGDRSKEKQFDRKQRRNKKSRAKAARKKMNDVHGGEEDFSSAFSTLSNDLDSDSASSKSKSKAYEDVFGSSSFDSFASSSNYGYRHSKKLMKSRTNKKWAGVCGGLAKYFGISSTVVRFIFVAAFFMGYGTSLLIYFGLALAMPKEPVDLMDDFEF